MAGFLPITSLFAGLHILVLAVLSFTVATNRGQLMGDKKDPEKDAVFKRKAAAQTNFYQYLPAILLALALLEGNEVLSPSYLYILGIIITVARLSHTGQLFFPDQIPMPFRMAGFLTTALFLLATSTLLILLGLQEAGLLPDNFLVDRRTWFGFAKDNYDVAADHAQAGYNAASAHAKTGYQKAKATIKEKAAEL